MTNELKPLSKKHREHHVWCNYFMRPLEECPQCAGLYENYPPEGLGEDELIAKHFPDVVVLPKTGEKQA